MATPPEAFEMTDIQARPNSPPTPLITLSDLRGSSLSPTFWYRVHVLVFDLRNFNKDSSKKQEAEKIKHIVTDTRGKTFSETLEEGLDERLERRKKKRVQSGDFRVCAAHDLAPLIASALGIDLKQMEKDKDFAQVVELKGLNLRGEIWGGLKKKSFAPRKRDDERNPK
ncbi:hypothetical protein BO83DRAFT_426208 [Aspergillus eucalypticola CBS 122712]|uniref:Uncharacterized protein n=1 Tax=Aspergillus eucalypticola (strain CBS 122712 / IBT 29274) TaxID=1448314 RepID=A0A317VNQ0_ASPEC|nr:uncharacterized protein BO83DRAFT_426208 [Aspergillus eucalypticola CBS 122712]PWY75956.1 hypothetical protein BO83DRAFT_426208 [Aspergillus eucalypticola CBS 122712]